MTDISRRHLIEAVAGLAAIAGTGPAFAQSGASRNYRARLALKPGLIYVNAANLCPTFRSASAAEQAASDALQSNPAQEYRRRFNQIAATLHARFAKRFNTVTDAIALTRNCSEASGNVLRGVRLKAGDEVIIGRENHPSNSRWWHRRQQTEGIVVKVADPPDEPTTQQQVLDAYLKLAGPRTRAIALSHMTNIGGLIAPVEEIGRFARARNIWFHLDCAQTFGWMKLDVAAIGCDSFAGSTHKWMMGPIGGGVLYVRPERLGELDPLMMSVDYYHTGPRDAVNAQAFEYLGQRPDAMLPGLIQALDERDAIGEDTVEHIVRANAVAMRKALDAKGVRVVGDGDPKLWGPVLACNVKGMPERHAELYQKHQVVCSATHIAGKTLLRLSPHFYNTIDELNRLAALMA